jgi:FKBP-type peptidyl-prolyl cis-trans isomerase 2
MFNEDGGTEYITGKPDKIFRKTKSGLEFRFITTAKANKYPNVGDVIYIDMTYKTEKDSIIFRSKSVDKDFKMRLTIPSHKGGCLEEAFLMMSEGDSASFRIDAANFLTFTQGKVNLPSYVKKGDKFIFNIKMKKVVDGSDYVKENADLYSYYLSQETSLIERYLLNLSYPLVKKESGLRIITISKGKGKKPVKGNAVTIDYTAAFIDGSVFDSSIERKQPFRFILGAGEVIDGLDEGVSNMNIGDHCMFVIPFRLAYGDVKSGIIPPFSTLVFEVELLNAK